MDDPNLLDQPFAIAVGDFVTFLNDVFRTVTGEVTEVTEIGEDRHRMVMVHTTSGDNVIIDAEACVWLGRTRVSS